MIDRSSGVLRLGGSMPIGPGLTREAFLAAPVGAGAVVWVANEPYCSFRTEVRADPERFVLVVWFHGARLTHVTLHLLDGPASASWDDWSEARERERRAAHDAWLRSQLGPPPYRYAWGSVESTYDARSGSSDIIIQYRRRRRFAWPTGRQVGQ